jgi:hypothetical protein
MHIPLYWAQARLRHSTGQRHGATVQRWGWSDNSQRDAQAHAEQRARQALDAMLATSKMQPLDAGFQRMEWKGEYGLDGATPIREEVLERRDCAVLTRNSYGAHCLNTEQVAIADMDFPKPPPPARFPLLTGLVLTAAIVWLAIKPPSATVVMLSGIVVTALMAWRCMLSLRTWQQARRVHAQALAAPPPLQTALERVRNLARQHPLWGLRVYQTPKGLRVIVTHSAFDHQALEVKILFEALQVDPLYAMLCEKQKCFRARVTGKPWRMGMTGLSTQDRRWPTQPKRQPSRDQWCRTYDQKATGFAACRVLEQLGQGAIGAQVRDFVQWHDLACNAQSTLALA